MRNICKKVFTVKLGKLVNLDEVFEKLSKILLFKNLAHEEDIENGKFSNCVIQVRKQNLKCQENFLKK